MKVYVVRLIRLVGGLFLYSLGVVFSLNANIGYAPWEVFHVGLSKTLGMSIGAASIAAGLAIVLIVLVMGEKMGLGTILNMLLIGAMLDGIMLLNFIPSTDNFVIGVFMLIAGMFIISLGTYFYIGSGFGAGPRDSLMVALTRKTKLTVGVCRSTIEFTVVCIGWLLGGMVGAGTVISVLGIGLCIQRTFMLLKFKPTEVTHETLGQTYILMSEKLGRRKKELDNSESEIKNTPKDQPLE